MRKVLIFFALQMVIVGGAAAPAFAHGSGGPDASDYKSVVLNISNAGADAGEGPQSVGFEILANDALLEATNRGGDEIVILGYSDEPYLRIGPQGVFRNTNSPATYINADRFANVDVPSDVSASAEPEWEKVSDDSRYAWHDHRVHWMAATLPQQVASNDKDTVIKIFDWAVPFKVGEESFLVSGRLDWIRPPAVWPWLLAGLLVTSLPLLAAYTKPAGDERKLMLKRTFAVVLATIVVLDIVHSIDDIFAVPATLGENISASLQSALFLGLGAYGAVWAWRARGGAWVGILLGAFGIALGIGATHLISLTSSQIATNLSPEFTRFVIGASIAVLVPAGFVAWRTHEPVLVESRTTT